MAQKPKVDPHVGRLGYLQALVTEFQETASRDAKEQVLANLANFAYDPGNYEYLRQLQEASATCVWTGPTRSTSCRQAASRSSPTAWPAPTRRQCCPPSPRSCTWARRAPAPTQSSPPCLSSSACCASLSRPTRGSGTWLRSSWKTSAPQAKWLRHAANRGTLPWASRCRGPNPHSIPDPPITVLGGHRKWAEPSNPAHTLPG
ncbi:armadillo repeat-containing protein 7 isoform X1 [Ochotona curzoniae]|uniref:armadillo repeat-containing protein 7 isoform X1 n=1 Tax=Ochotona curzoniae TaxID=130825 RepID=UPI001B34813B|nr:armadillo repeat-containing protein 7 isoform X1 [Ochotona curzoniae]